MIHFVIFMTIKTYCTKLVLHVCDSACNYYLNDANVFH